MNLPGLLIEYLITGCTALIWIWVLSLLPNIQLPLVELPPEKLTAAHIAILAPVVYVAGMVVDFTAKGVCDALEFMLVDKLWEWARPKIGDKIPKEWTRLASLRKRLKQPRVKKDAKFSYAEVMFHSQDLGKQLEMRSSRDRVARGTFLNVLLTTILLTIYFRQQYNPLVSIRSVLFSGLVISTICFVMWYRYKERTSRYHRKASEALESSSTSVGGEAA